jgi:hypothetical protein
MPPNFGLEAGAGHLRDAAEVLRPEMPPATSPLKSKLASAVRYMRVPRAFSGGASSCSRAGTAVPHPTHMALLRP